MDDLDEERINWGQLAAAGLARAYGEDEPEYGPEDVKACHSAGHRLDLAFRIVQARRGWES
jgi:hypothetical protein